MLEVTLEITKSASTSFLSFLFIFSHYLILPVICFLLNSQFFFQQATHLAFTLFFSILDEMLVILNFLKGVWVSEMTTLKFQEMG